MITRYWCDFSGNPPSPSGQARRPGRRRLIPQTAWRRPTNASARAVWSWCDPPPRLSPQSSVRGHMFKAIAAGLTLVLAIGSAAQARPFTAKDLAMLDRVSAPQISPDGRLVAYNVRSTDWDANRGVNALWVLERGAAGAAPRLIRDQEKGATAPQWSADGRWLRGGRPGGAGSFSSPPAPAGARSGARQPAAPRRGR